MMTVPSSKKTPWAVFILSMAPLASPADNARDWQNLPIDMNIIGGYYLNSNSNTSLDASIPKNGLSLNTDLYIARFSRTLSIDGRYSVIHIVQPYADIYASFDNGQLSGGNQRNGGMADTQFVLAHNLFGARALTKGEFVKRPPETFLTGVLWLTAPTGDYDKDRVINIGSNRWVFKPQIAFGTPIGPTWLELNTYVSLYGNNNDYRGNGEFEQKPLYTIEGHYSYTINRSLWASVDTKYSRGGETKVNANWQDNKQEEKVLGASLGFRLSRQLWGMIAYTDTVVERAGSADLNTWTLRMQYAW